MEKVDKCSAKIEWPLIRGSFIWYLMDLMDTEYQVRKWTGNRCEYPYIDPNTSFYANISNIFDEFDAFGLFECLKKKKLPLDKIGLFLKTKQEGKVLCKVARYLRLMYHSCFKNEEYLSSPYLPKLRRASKKAFDTFMISEQDNKEFLVLVEQAKKEQKRTW